jgi:hypothetical protein
VIISQLALRGLAMASDVPGAAALAGTLDPAVARPLRGTVVVATDVVDTYRARLARWLADGTPPGYGLPDFTAALEAFGHLQVGLVAHRKADTRFVVLLALRPLALAGVVAIESGRTFEFLRD